MRHAELKGNCLPTPPFPLEITPGVVWPVWAVDNTIDSGGNSAQREKALRSPTIPDWPMAQHPAQLDPLAALALSDAPAASNDSKPAPGDSSIANLSSAILADGTGNVSADMALDLVLTDVVEQARLATGATAAAVALRRGSEIICRAMSGPNAPDLGSRLDQYSGLSGACVQSKTFQRCDDSESDARVDAALCRR